MDGRTDASIQEITEAAGVGFGSFYNHFDTKDELFDAALAQTLIGYGRLRDQVVDGLTDPVEVFTVGFRLTGRLSLQNPGIMRLLLHGGTAVLSSDHGLRPRALQDLHAARAAGRFTFDDPEIAFMAIGSGLIGMMQLLSENPDRDVATTTDEFVVLALRMLGVSAEDAATLVARPLPPVPDLSEFVPYRGE